MTWWNRVRYTLKIVFERSLSKCFWWVKRNVGSVFLDPLRRSSGFRLEFVERGTMSVHVKKQYL